MPDMVSLIPEINDEDIEWVCSLLGIESLDEPRREFLKRRTTVDVSACPGSGKTTLIVAKLAILARKWPHRTQGICVLSHTNVAREQIEQRLGRSGVGQLLLGYPHFIDTIHGFVNRFLAVPWLQSNGYPTLTIDDDITTAYRRGILDRKDYWTVQSFLARKFSDFGKLRIRDRYFSFDLDGKPFPAQPSALSFQHAKRAIEIAAKAGYFCHNEMFVWAGALLEDFPDTATWLKRRFPLVVLDEMQDTDAQQGSFLNVVFPRNSDHIVIQRVGDPNQKIFNSEESKADNTDPFPDLEPCRRLDISNSYRFGTQIAALASPFAAEPVRPNGLCGLASQEQDTTAGQRKHAIFLFPNDSTDGVLDAYGEHVLSVIGAERASKGLVTAVGHIHQDEPEVEARHFPKKISHYWDGYSADLSRREPYPRTLVQYILAAHAQINNSRALSPGVEKFAHGILQLARRMGDIGNLKRRAHTHRTITTALKDKAEAYKAYQRLLRVFLLEKPLLSAGTWPSYREEILCVAAALCQGSSNRGKPDAFLAWPEGGISRTSAASSTQDSIPNIYRVTNGSESVDIRLGSIHSVKGQTHLATLLLNTYWHDHSAERMLPWLLGNKTNRNEAGNGSVLSALDSSELKIF